MLIVLDVKNEEEEEEEGVPQSRLSLFRRLMEECEVSGMMTWFETRSSEPSVRKRLITGRVLYVIPLSVIKFRCLTRLLIRGESTSPSEVA